MTAPSTKPKDAAPLKSGQWAVNASVKATSLRNLTAIAMADPRNHDDPRRRAVADAVHEFLDAADRASQRRGWLRQGPIDRWRGTSVVLAYQSLHAAEVFLVELLSLEQIAVMVPTVVARIQTVCDPADPRRTAIDQLPQQVADRVPGVRSAIQQAMRIGYEFTDEMHVRVRNFRNMLLASAALILLLMGGLVLAAAQRPGALPMCFAPGSTVSAPAKPILSVCPSGDDHPSGGDVLIVAGLGLLGGALAAAFSIRNVRGTSTPYDVPVALAVLKPPLGALTAVTSILLLGGKFVPGLSELDNQRQILAYALVFGYAQQLVSRLIDNQGQTLLNNLPSKDPEAKKPVAAVPTTTIVSAADATPESSAPQPAQPPRKPPSTGPVRRLRAAVKPRRP